MKPWTMSSYNGPRMRGADYSIAARDLLPELIGTKPLTVIEIADKIGRTHQGMGELMTKLHRKGLVHIAGWKRSTSGPMKKRYLWGPGEDMPKPTPYTQAQRCKRYHASIKGKAVMQAIRIKQKIKAGGLRSVDPLMAAIMGV